MFNLTFYFKQIFVQNPFSPWSTYKSAGVVRIVTIEKISNPAFHKNKDFLRFNGFRFCIYFCKVKIISIYRKSRHGNSNTCNFSRYHSNMVNKFFQYPNPVWFEDRQISNQIVAQNVHWEYFALIRSTSCWISWEDSRRIQVSLCSLFQHKTKN